MVQRLFLTSIPVVSVHSRILEILVCRVVVPLSVHLALGILLVVVRQHSVVSLLLEEHRISVRMGICTWGARFHACLGTWCAYHCGLQDIRIYPKFDCCDGMILVIPIPVAIAGILQV